MDTKRTYFVAILVLLTMSLRSQDFQWSFTTGSSGLSFSTGWSVTIDDVGNTITSGHYMGTADFDPGPGIFNLTSNGFEDIFVQKVDSDGNLVWAVSMGGVDQDFGYAITHDSSGDLYIAGGYNQTADLDPGPGVINRTAVGEIDVFVMKLDSNGLLQWVKTYGSTDVDIPSDIIVNDQNEVYVSGTIYGTVDFDPDAGIDLRSVNGESDAYLHKLDQNGNHVWVATFGGVDYDYGRCISLSPSGDVLVGGTFKNTVDFDPGPGINNISSLGNSGGFIVKLNGLGDLQWATAVQSTEFIGIGSESMVTDSNGDIYVGGRYRGQLAGTSYSSTDPMDFYLTKLDPDGNVTWTNNLEVNFNTFLGLYLAIDQRGFLYTVGKFGNVMDMDPGDAIFEVDESANVHAVFLQKFDLDGNFIWGGSMGSTTNISPRSIYANDGIISITGGFEGVADIDPTISTSSNTSIGRKDVYITSLDECNIGSSLSAITVCDSFTTPGNEFTWTSSGLYKYMVPGTNNCDSLVGVDLIINPSEFVSISIESCDSYESPSQLLNWTQSGIYNDIIPTMLGCDSLISIDLTIKSSSSSSINQEACIEYVSPSGQLLSGSGIYSDIISNSTGCDSLITIDLTIYTLPGNEIIVSGDTLISSLNNANYQWINCDSGSPIQGAINKIFIPSSSGNYNVEILQDGCVFESNCQPFQYRERECIESISPNPSNGPLSISLGDTFEEVSVELFDISGKMIDKYDFINTDKIEWDINPSSGMYLLFITCQDRKELRRIVFD